MKVVDSHAAAPYLRPEAEDALDEMAWAFGLAGPEARLFTRGLCRRLPPGDAATLGDRVRAFFETAAPGDAPRLLVGALPFDRMADDCLFQPRSATQTPWPASGRSLVNHGWAVTPEPPRAAYEDAVARALSMIAASADEGVLEKVVLSRSLRLEAAGVIDPFALMSSLSADPSATRFLTPLGSSPTSGMRRLVGASPELLVSRRGEEVLSHPLAGSARRAPDLAQDEASARGLMRSEKDRREHRVVVEAILDALAPLCRELSAPPEPALVSTRTMWHLGTRIEGRLKHPDAVSAAALAAVLHPTPAVAGVPRERATRAIAELEGYDRGFYAGAVGWTDEFGDGAWYVSLRCAEVAGAAARLYAGAGVVMGSVPSAEGDETSAKFQAMLRAFGVEEGGEPIAAPTKTLGTSA